MPCAASSLGCSRLRRPGDTRGGRKGRRSWDARGYADLQPRVPDVQTHSLRAAAQGQSEAGGSAAANHPRVDVRVLLCRLGALHKQQVQQLKGDLGEADFVIVVGVQAQPEPIAHAVVDARVRRAESGRVREVDRHKGKLGLLWDRAEEGAGDVDRRLGVHGVVRHVGDKLHAGHLAERVEEDARVVQIRVRSDVAVHGVAARVDVAPARVLGLGRGARHRLLRKVVDVDAVAEARALCTHGVGAR